MKKSKSSRAGIQFPVARIARKMKASNPKMRFSAGSSVYVAAVLEYLIAEITELSGDVAKQWKKRRLTPRHIFLALSSDDELHTLLKNVMIPQGGVIPKILPELLPKNKKATKTPNKAQPQASNQQNSVPSTSSSIKKNSSIKKSVSKRGRKGLSPKKGSTSKDDQIIADPNKSKPGISVLAEKNMQNGGKFLVLRGDILQIEADVIVHPTDENFSTIGQIGEALRNAGGKDFTDMISKMKSDLVTLRSLDAVLSNSFNTVAKFVIHCNGPTRKDSQTESKLEEVFQRCLVLAYREGLKSITFPLIGTGRGGLPKPEVARVFLQTISNYYATTDYKNKNMSISRIYLVVHDNQSTQAVMAELAKI